MGGINETKQDGWKDEADQIRSARFVPQTAKKKTHKSSLNYHLQRLSKMMRK